MSALFVDEVEHTGPVVRVWVAGVSDAAAQYDRPAHLLEDAARAVARDHLGTAASPEVVFHLAHDSFEVIFEAGDLA